MSNLGQTNLSVKNTNGQEEGELEDIEIKYHSCYELKRKVDTHKHVKQCTMQKTTRIIEDQTCCAFEVVIPVENVVRLKSLNICKNHMQKVIVEVGK
jgi:hypothetical protein